MTVGEFFSNILFGIVLVGIIYLDYRIMVAVKKQKLAFVVFAFSIVMAFVPFAAYGFYTLKFKKVLKTNCEMVSKLPSDSSVDVFLNYVKQWGFYNHPEQWNQIRGVWFIINESSNVSTYKKKELRDYLMTNGLRMNNSEKQIIDNYSK